LTKSFDNLSYWQFFLTFSAFGISILAMSPLTLQDKSKMAPRKKSPPAAPVETPSKKHKPVSLNPEDEWVPLRLIAKEFHVTLRCVHRWRTDPKLGFPRIHALNGIGYATRADLRAFKSRLANGEPPKMRGRR
jgi:hypothetical protein